VCLLHPQDNSLNFVRNVSQAAALAGLGAYAWVNDFEGGKILALVVSVLFAVVSDQVGPSTFCVVACLLQLTAGGVVVCCGKPQARAKKTACFV
jgi:hypothetical protein